MKIWTEDDQTRAQQMRADGVSYRGIADALGVSKTVVRFRLGTMPDKPSTSKRFAWTEASEQRAVKLRNDGSYYFAIANQLGCSESAVCALFARLKATPPASSITPPLTIVNAAMRERLTGGTWMPTRPGAMDYLACKSRGIA